MRVRLCAADADPILCKFDGTIDGLFDSAAAKLGWRPVSFTVCGARLTSTDDLEDNDEITCEREATSASRKRPLEEADSNSVAAPSSATTPAGAGSDCMQPASDQMTIRVVDQHTNEVFFKVRPTTKVQKILRAYTECHNVSLGTFRFTYDGIRLPDLKAGVSDDTIAKWQMEGGDQIDVRVEILGGGPFPERPELTSLSVLRIATANATIALAALAIKAKRVDQP